MKFKKLLSFAAGVAMLANMSVFTIASAEETYYNPDTLIAYADFELGGWSYLQGVEEVETTYCNSGKKAGKVSSKNADLRVNGSNLKLAPTPVDPDTYFKIGNKYKISFYAATDNTTATVYYHLMRNGSATISEWQTLTNEMTYYSFIYEPVINTNTIPFIRTATKATYYIDDYLVEELKKPTLVSSTLPEDNTTVSELGYKEYTLTFDKNIKSATVSGITSGKASISGKTVTVNGALITSGEQTIEVTITDSDNITSTVSRTVNVADKLVAYAGFDTDGGGHSYMQNIGDHSTEIYHSGTRSGVVSSGLNDVHFQQRNWSSSVFKNDVIKASDGSYTAAIVPGKKYKMSYYAYAVPEENCVYKMGIAQSNSAIQTPVDIIADEKWHLYELEFTAIQNVMPRFYRGDTTGTIYLDDIIIQKVNETDDAVYSYNGIFANGVAASNLEAEKTYTAKGYITNVSNDEAIDGIVYFAMYKDGRLEKVAVSDTAITAEKGGEIKSTECTLTTPSDVTGLEAKAFLWTTDMTPLSMTCIPQ